MSTTSVTIEGLRGQVADIFEQQFGLPRDRLLADELFIDLDPDFDSLSMVQVQIFIEEFYAIRFARSQSGPVNDLPLNLSEFVAVLYPRLVKALDDQP